MELVYLIRWRDCIDKVVNKGDIKIMSVSEEGLLLSTNDDAGFVDKAIDAGCTAYARYYRFRLIRAGDFDRVEKLIRPFDAWLSGDVLNLVVNPLRLSTVDVARALYSLDFELELLSEDDVEFMK